MTQGTLFSIEPASPMARNTDPPTSKAASKTVDVNAREQECLDALRFLVVASSAYEVACCLQQRNLPRQVNCVSRRLGSLVKKGLVDARGVKPGPYGRDVTAYRLRGVA